MGSSGPWKTAHHPAAGVIAGRCLFSHHCSLNRLESALIASQGPSDPVGVVGIGFPSAAGILGYPV